MAVVVTRIERVDAALVARFERLGVATVHEAQGRKGLMAHSLRPIFRPIHAAGSAVTCEVAPGDNWMIHVAVEQCREGDVLVVTTTSPSVDGAFGELFATALQARGVRGLVTTTGVRDTAELREMGFPVWSAAVSAQGTVKATPGSVNVPVVVGGVHVRPGDAIVADDDGVLVVPRDEVGSAITASRSRLDKEAADRAAYAGGELSLDRKGLRAELDRLGVTWEAYRDDD